MQPGNLVRDECASWLHLISPPWQPAFVLLSVSCLACQMPGINIIGVAFRVSPACQPALVLQLTPVPWQSDSHSFVPTALTLVMCTRACLHAASEPLSLPVRCPYLGGTEERLIEQQAACLRAVTDHQQRQVKAADWVIPHPHTVADKDPPSAA